MLTSLSTDGGASGTKSNAPTAGRAANSSVAIIVDAGANDTTQSCSADGGKRYAVVDAGLFCGDDVIDEDIG